MSGYVYVLTNPSMPDLVKIGRSSSGGKRRAAELYTTGVPQPFVLEFEIFSSEPAFLEKAVHEELAEYRLPGREFFTLDVQDAVKVVADIALSSDWSLSVTDDVGGECIKSVESIVTSYPDIGTVYGEIYVAAALRFLDKEHVQLALDKFNRHLADRREQKEAQS